MHNTKLDDIPSHDNTLYDKNGAAIVKRIIIKSFYPYASHFFSTNLCSKYKEYEEISLDGMVLRGPY